MKIRYRVWDVFANEMVYPDESYYRVEQDGTLRDFEGDLCQENKEMLSTGQNDCEGKEIFAGDVIDYGGRKFEVEFENAQFGCIPIGVMNCFYVPLTNLHVRHPEAIKIIGNIHENPELLEG